MLPLVLAGRAVEIKYANSKAFKNPGEPTEQPQTCFSKRDPVDSVNGSAAEPLTGSLEVTHTERIAKTTTHYGAKAQLWGMGS